MAIKLSCAKTDEPIEMPFVGSGVGTMGTGGYIVPPKFRTCTPLYPPSQRCGLCQNFKQTTLTTRLYKVRTNLYPPLTKTFRHACLWGQSPVPGVGPAGLRNCVIWAVKVPHEKGETFELRHACVFLAIFNRRDATTATPGFPCRSFPRQLQMQADMTTRRCGLSPPLIYAKRILFIL